MIALVPPLPDTSPPETPAPGGPAPPRAYRIRPAGRTGTARCRKGRNGPRYRAASLAVEPVAGEEELRARLPRGDRDARVGRPQPERLAALEYPVLTRAADLRRATRAQQDPGAGVGHGDHVGGGGALGVQPAQEEL